ncbi:MAG: hypothetical protein IPM82_22050 [Saprospiraceae bacterium]|nr:hypothetical protein [Saprospiraceae bacterium]
MQPFSEVVKTSGQFAAPATKLRYDRTNQRHRLFSGNMVAGTAVGGHNAFHG